MALDHPEWDLFAYSRVDSDYWEVEVLAEGADTPTEVSTGSIEGRDPAKEVREVGGQITGEIHTADAYEETVLIVDNKPAA